MSRFYLFDTIRFGIRITVYYLGVSRIDTDSTAEIWKVFKTVRLSKLIGDGRCVHNSCTYTFTYIYKLNIMYYSVIVRLQITIPLV